MLAAVCGPKPSKDEERLVKQIVASGKAELGNREFRAKVIREICIYASSGRLKQVGRLTFVGGTLTGPLDLTGLKLDYGLQFKGTKMERLVLGDTRLVALDLLGGQATSVEANRVEVDHDLVFGKGFTCTEGLGLRSAKIGGDLNCAGAHIYAKEDSSLNLDGARIGSRLYLRNSKSSKFHANRRVSVQNARIGGAILCNGGHFDRGLNFYRTQVQGDVSLSGATIGAATVKLGAEPSAKLVMGSMRIAGELAFWDTDYRGPLIDLRGTHVDGSLVWRLQRCAPRSRDFKVDLMQARVGYLHDVLDCWHGAEVVLDGFSLSGIDVSGTNWLEKRKTWLGSQPEGDWSPHPYDQVRAALRDSGHETKARDIAVEREDVRLRLGGMSKLGKAVHRLYGGLLGYGYKPFRFFLVSAIVVLLFAAFFCTLDSCDLPTAARTCGEFSAPGAGAAPYDALLFSMDAFVPVDLGQTGAWQPTDVWLSYLVAFETSLGWLFAALVLGAVTGVLRRD